MSIFTINHNIPSINSQRHINNTSLGLSKSLEKLSSGLRINTGWDGPADLVISEQLRGELGGIKAAIRNGQEAMNMLSVAEGALNEISTLLQDLRAKAIHAANTGVVGLEQVRADQAEVDNALAGINRLAQVTEYADKKVFYTSAKVFHIGPGGTAAVDEVKFSTRIPSVAYLGLQTISAGAGAAGYNLSLKPNQAVSLINTAVLKVTSLRGRIGSFMKNQLNSTINTLNVAFENVTASESYIRDTNMAEEISNYTKHQIMVQAGMSVLSQANVSAQSVLQLLG